MHHWNLILSFVANFVGFGLGAYAAGSSGSSAMECTEEASGGATTVFDETRSAYSLPAHNLSDEKRGAFFVGNSFFNQNWVAAPSSVVARDGLGPLFNARSCSGCHFKDGRGRPPEDNQPMTEMLLRISVPGNEDGGECVPEPTYGDQIQTMATGRIAREADVLVRYQYTWGRFQDGEEFGLRQPVYVITNVGYGPFSTNLLMSGRVAPSMIGLGLLEAIPENTLQRLADPEDEDHDGISGRLNRVWDHGVKRMLAGRFGWKAEQPSVRQQIAAALLGDMGLTTTLFPGPNYTSKERACAEEPNGGDPEVNEEIFRSMVFYSRVLAVPARRLVLDPSVVRGKRIFEEIGCVACHVPELETGEVSDIPELSRQRIHPYTDLLLHDMGEGLDDQRAVSGAIGREWRTPPLWGAGLVSKVNGHTFLLHDGRARNPGEAILWHGGEAEASKERFRRKPKSEREDLLAFLGSL